MKPNLFHRMAALTLAAALAAEPAVGSVGAAFHPRPRLGLIEMAGRHGDLPLQLFSSQALAQPAMSPLHSEFPVAKIQAIETAWAAHLYGGRLPSLQPFYNKLEQKHGYIIGQALAPALIESGLLVLVSLYIQGILNLPFELNAHTFALTAILRIVWHALHRPFFVTWDTGMITGLNLFGLAAGIHYFFHLAGWEFVLYAAGVTLFPHFIIDWLSYPIERILRNAENRAAKGYQYAWEDWTKSHPTPVLNSAQREIYNRLLPAFADLEYHPQFVETHFQFLSGLWTNALKTPDHEIIMSQVEKQIQALIRNLSRTDAVSVSRILFWGYMEMAWRLLRQPPPELGSLLLDSYEKLAALCANLADDNKPTRVLEDWRRVKASIFPQPGGRRLKLRSILVGLRHGLSRVWTMALIERMNVSAETSSLFLMAYITIHLSGRFKKESQATQDNIRRFYAEFIRTWNPYIMGTPLWIERAIRKMTRAVYSPVASQTPPETAPAFEEKITIETGIQSERGRQLKRHIEKVWGSGTIENVPTVALIKAILGVLLKKEATTASIPPNLGGPHGGMLFSSGGDWINPEIWKHAIEEFEPASFYVAELLDRHLRQKEDTDRTRKVDAINHLLHQAMLRAYDQHKAHHSINEIHYIFLTWDFEKMAFHVFDDAPGVPDENTDPPDLEFIGAMAKPYLYKSIAVIVNGKRVGNDMRFILPKPPLAGPWTEAPPPAQPPDSADAAPAQMPSLRRHTMRPGQPRPGGRPDYPKRSA